MVAILCFFIFAAHDAEGRIYGLLIGFILGGSILAIMTALGFGFAVASRGTEQCRRLSLVGLILNSILLTGMLSHLIPLIARFSS